MATAKYIGGSLNRKQKDTITIANTWAANDTITCTISNVDFIVTIGTLVTTAQVATTLQQALSGTTFTDTTASSTIAVADGGAALVPQFSEFTATVSGSVVTCTANGSSPAALAGKPFTLSVTETTAGDGTATEATSVTATSQWHADQADNWHLNTVPGNGDTVVFDAGSTHCRYSLDLGAIAVAQFTKYKACTSEIGLARVNTDQTAKPYPEYRTPRYLTADGFTNADIEVGDGPGSSRIYLDGGTVQSAYNIFGKGTRAETGLPCVLIIGANNSNVVRNLAGDVGVAFYPDETATLATLISGDGPNSQASTICGPGVTFNSATVTCNGGYLETASALATGVQNAGAWVHRAGTITSMTVNKGATHYPLGAATYTTIDINGGTVDCRKGLASFVVTNAITMSAGSSFLDPQGRAGNIVVTLRDCTLEDVTIVTQQGKTITLS